MHEIWNRALQFETVWVTFTHARECRKHEFSLEQLSRRKTGDRTDMHVVRKNHSAAVLE